MHYTRIYSDKKGHSHFKDEDITLINQGKIGELSRPMPTKAISFRETQPDYDYDFHNAPDKQFIILLDGKIEIETSLGDKRTFGQGDILLVEDVTGKGHKTRALNDKTRRSIFITLP